MTTKKVTKRKTGRIIDKRTKQVWKQYEDGIKDRDGCCLIPKGATNELMDLMYKGEVIGDVEIGSDGFLEIMLTIGGRFLKLKREEDKVYLSLY